MERTPKTPAGASGAADFAAWLHDQLTRRGYDLGIRGGGQTRFAEDSGIGRATISRILSGQGATDTRVLAVLAQTLRVPLATVLVQAGILTEAELAAVRAPDTDRPLTPDEAATELGIVEPTARAVFAATVDTLRQTQAQRSRRAEQ